MPVGQLKYHMVTIEDLVPQDHFLRKLDAALDLSFVYEETAHLYSHRYGRPPIDPVILVKYLLVGYLYNIGSEREIEKRINDSNSLRWYLGLDLERNAPDQHTITPFVFLYFTIFSEVMAALCQQLHREKRLSPQSAGEII